MVTVRPNEVKNLAPAGEISFSLGVQKRPQGRLTAVVIIATMASTMRACDTDWHGMLGRE